MLLVHKRKLTRCGSCGYRGATDYEGTLFGGGKIECDAIRIIDTYHKATFDKWGNIESWKERAAIC
jgi:hypothetical protein